MMELMWFILWELPKHVSVQMLIPAGLVVVCCAGQGLLAFRCGHPADLVLPAVTGLALRAVVYCGSHVPAALFDAAPYQLWACGAFYGTMAGWVVGYLLKQTEKGSCRNI